MKKKILSFVLAICLVIPALMFVGCGKNPPDDKLKEYAGTYKVERLIDTEFDLDVTKEQYQANPSNYDEWDISGWFEMTIILNENGNFEQHQEGSSFIQEGSWTIAGDKLKLIVDNELYFEFIIINNSTVTLNPYSNTTLTLSKV